MSNLMGRQDVPRENFEELHINFPFAINPGLTNLKRESVTLPCSIEFTLIQSEEVAKKTLLRKR
jgi:hypothetical protein